MNKEKPHNRKWKKIVISVSLIVVILIAGIIIFISPLTKYLVEKYDKKYLGREVSMDWAYVNPFTGYVHFDNLKIFENENDTVFLSANGVSANFEMHTLLYKPYEISSLTLSHPIIRVVKTEKIFNFNDLILKFSDKDSLKPKTKKEPLHLNVLKIAIKNGEISFLEPKTPIKHTLKNVNITTDGKYWDNDTLKAKISLTSDDNGGSLKSNFAMNLKTMDYNFGAIIKDFNLIVFEQYLKDLANFSNIAGKLNANIDAKGNFKNNQNLDGKGSLLINNFHFGKDSTNDFVSFNNLDISFNQISPSKKIYLFDSVMLDKPIFKFEKYDYLDNIQTMFGKEGSKIKDAKQNPEKFNLILTLSEYIQNIFKNFFKSNYQINSFAVNDANLKYNDYSQNEKFSAGLFPLNIKADSVNNKRDIVNMVLNSGIKPYGNMQVTLNFYPNNNNNFNLNYKLQQIPVPLFNPYIISYTSFPLDRGRLELFGNWQVRNDIIQSENHLIVIDPRISDRIRKKDSRWLPLPLIMFVVKERGNVIDYEIPITGNLKNPKFNFWDVIIDAIQNIFIKPPTTPYRFNVRNTESEIEKSLSLSWQMRQTKLTKSQERFLNKISDFLKDNPEAMITIHPTTYADKEKEHILFFEAKKRYYLSCGEKKPKQITEDDSMAIEKMSSKDEGFIKYLDKYKDNSKLYTVQDKCYQIVGYNLVNKEFEKLIDSRNKAFVDYFKMEKTNAQIKILSNKNAVPFNGFSDFMINYKGDFPDYLIEASQQLNKFNANAPRNKYKKFRGKQF